ncbi:single-stranded-DNA-specific exonuclease RecJ [Hydrogenovibrio kuenenii]|uniref:single-stranded-DNA-specific exonuclease RecJ n=1 Tax=Hydrogenovibrio kuenenii TaxID=63658 RepID=UPI0004652B84|nr:DHH family phosphoesterase [Hydrogenovibrio kuenenii]
MLMNAKASSHKPFELQQPEIVERPFSQKVFDAANQLGLTQLQARLVAMRLSDEDFENHDNNMSEMLEKIVFPKLRHLQHPQNLKNADQAAKHIADAILSDGQIVLATDYDTDGVTSAWVATRALIDYFHVPEERITHVLGDRKSGYGITDKVVERILAIDKKIDLVISADQGSSDELRIKKLADKGIPVCVTDHHQIPANGIPESAICTVNPQQENCQYDKTVAGCFVIFLVMGQTRNELIHRGVLDASAPSLKDLVMNVSLGTVADSVSLKGVNNRAVVQAGLTMMNELKHPSWQAMHALNDNNNRPFNAEYLGFQVATRINAASRVSDVTTAFRFLNAEDFYQAQQMLDQLEADNLNRREQQESMLLQAKQTAESIYHPGKFTLVIKMQGNAGIQGIIASRVGEQYGLPTIAMTDLQDGFLAGSGRGIISNIDLREAFQWMSEQDRELFESMGGHKGAAGCMIPIDKFDSFSELFEQAIREQLDNKVPRLQIETDGELEPWQLTPALIDEINLLEPYGRDWPKPLFHGKFSLKSYRVVGQTQTHLSFNLATQDGRHLSAIFFNALDSEGDPIPYQAGQEILCVYQPALNHYMGNTNLQIRLVHAEAV